MSGFFSYGLPRPGGGDVSGCGDARTGWSYRLMYYTFDETHKGPYPWQMSHGDIVIGAYQYFWKHNGLPLGDRRCGKAVMGEAPTHTDTKIWGDGEMVGFARGKWTHIQQRVKPNTVAGDGGASGITELWINGVKTISNSSIDFVPDKTTQTYQLAQDESPNDYSPIRYFQFSPYHGGGDDWKTPDEVLYYIDNMVVSTEYIPSIGGH
jgi:hypothetical protein